MDGRVLVVEYKGKDRYDIAGSEEKRAISAVWASRSGRRCLLEMQTDVDFSGVIKSPYESVIQRKISPRVFRAVAG